jgi:hypothetical protein
MALEADTSKCVVGLFTIAVTSHHTLGNWYHFIMLIHHIKNLLTAKKSLNLVSFLLLLPSSVAYANGYCEECFYMVGQGGPGDEVKEPRGRWPEEFGNHRCRHCRHKSSRLFLMLDHP